MAGTQLFTYSRGSVVLLPFPFSDLQQAKLRPAILISDVMAFRSSTDGHFVYLTTKKPPVWMPCIEVGDGTETARKMNLRFEAPGASNFIVPFKLATVGLDLINRKIGWTPPDVLAEIDEHLRAVLALNR